jgi:hypothetical protein
VKPVLRELLELKVLGLRDNLSPVQGGVQRAFTLPAATLLYRFLDCTNQCYRRFSQKSVQKFLSGKKLLRDKLSD